MRDDALGNHWSLNAESSHLNIFVDSKCNWKKIVKGATGGKIALNRPSMQRIVTG